MREPTEEERDWILSKYTPAFSRIKNYSSKQIAEILVNSHNNGLLAICGGRFDEKDVEECFVALMMAISMLKENDLKLHKKYLEGENNQNG